MYLLSNFSEKVALGKKYGHIKGILWHQGETDANAFGAKRYHNNLTELFKTFRQIADNEKLPVLEGELGLFAKNNSSRKAINEILHAYAKSDPFTVVVSSSGLQEKGDGFHFDAVSQRELGKRFAGSYLDIFFSRDE